MSVKGEHRHKGSSQARANAWRSMRILREFTVDQLVATAGIGKANAYKYVRQLELAGYLGRMREPIRYEVGGSIVYRLLRNTGPEAPIAWLKGGCFDPNTRQAYGVELTDADLRKVIERGVFYAGTEYTAPELTLQEGGQVLVRPDERDHARLYVFDQDENLLCVAVPRKPREQEAQAANAKAAKLRKRQLGSERPRRTPQSAAI